jgi:hypothetical protein
LVDTSCMCMFLVVLIKCSFEGPKIDKIFVYSQVSVKHNPNLNIEIININQKLEL